MQNSFIQVTGDQLIIDREQLTMFAIAATVVVILIILIAISFKRRKKNFIKTVPTNLKDKA